MAGFGFSLRAGRLQLGLVGEGFGGESLVFCGTAFDGLNIGLAGMLAGFGFCKFFSGLRAPHSVGELSLHTKGIAMDKPAEQPAERPAEKPVSLRGTNGLLPDLRHAPRFHGIKRERTALSDAEVAVMLADVTLFLHQVVMATGHVLETVPAGELRKIVAAECDMPTSFVDENGIQRLAVANQPGRDHRKEPRGRKHPLMALLNLALQAARLLRQITAGTHPKLHNQRNKDEADFNRMLNDGDGWVKAIMKGAEGS